MPPRDQTDFNLNEESLQDTLRQGFDTAQYLLQNGPTKRDPLGTSGKESVTYVADTGEKTYMISTAVPTGAKIPPKLDRITVMCSGIGIIFERTDDRIRTTDLSGIPEGLIDATQKNVGKKRKQFPFFK